MGLRDYLDFLRKYWLTVVAFLAIGIGLGALFVASSTNRYESRTQLFVSTTGTDDSPGALVQAGQFIQGRVASYAALIDSPVVTQQVAAQVGEGLTPGLVGHEVSAVALAKTVLLDITVTDPSPRRAQRVATAIDRIFPDILRRLDAPSPPIPSPITVTVVKPATFSPVPVSPKKTLDLVVAAVVGLGLGLGVAVARAALDNSVKSAEDVQETTGGPLVGVIPFDRRSKNEPVFMGDVDQTARWESVRRLRTNLQFAELGAPVRSLVCTSSVYGEGKTFTVCSLAVAMADAGKRVLLIEADLRRPRLADYLGLDDAVGLADVLRGAVDVDDAVQRFGTDGVVDVLPSGPIPPKGSELLASQQMADLLRGCKQRYEMVLLDAPPVLPVADAAALAAMTDGALIVVRHGKTKRVQLQDAVAALAVVGARVLGSVVNFAPRRGPDAHGYGFSYTRRKVRWRLPFPPRPGDVVSADSTEDSSEPEVAAAVAPRADAPGATAPQPQSQQVGQASPAVPPGLPNRTSGTGTGWSPSTGPATPRPPYPSAPGTDGPSVNPA